MKIAEIEALVAKSDKHELAKDKRYLLVVDGNEWPVEHVMEVQSYLRHQGFDAIIIPVRNSVRLFEIEKEKTDG